MISSHGDGILRMGRRGFVAVAVVVFVVVCHEVVERQQKVVGSGQ